MLKFIKLLFKNKQKKHKNKRSRWEELSSKHVPKWVKNSFWKSAPSPVCRPPNFVMRFKGKTFRYKVEYHELGGYPYKTKIEYYRKLRRR